MMRNRFIHEESLQQAEQGRCLGAMNSPARQVDSRKHDMTNDGGRLKVALHLVAGGSLRVCDRGAAAEVPMCRRLHSTGSAALGNGQALLLPSTHARRSSASMMWHEIGAHRRRGARNGLQVGLPVAQVILGVVEDLPSLRGVLKGRARVSRHDGGVVEEVQQAAAVAGKHDLLLGPLDGGGEVDVVCFLELLTSLDVNM